MRATVIATLREHVAQPDNINAYLNGTSLIIAIFVNGRLAVSIY